MDFLKRKSIDGTVKYGFRTPDNNLIEAVFIPQKRTNVICLSSQVGCALKCKFCVTGYAGFTRNLSKEEIIEQYLAIITDQQLKELPNIVFMGMGEPLLNFEHVKEAVEYLHDALHLSKRKITLSTVGIVDKMSDTAKLGVQFALSLHAPSDALRRKIMPIAEKCSLKEIFEACKEIVFNKNKPFMIQYVMIDGINDKEEDAEQLIALLRQHPCCYVINLIPYNEHSFIDFKRSSDERLNHFKQQLIKAGFKTFIRETRGQDIAAACGMLRQRK
ncbi:23S rRNA (adenine(2503)-C(2))-methyltransferase RlmN [Candidatus Woesearchaeota archaeon]|nr:23S rRNA (adenine(2503)-C(2))-methyltransferase RlmN [Candidatus Woesearchaeota archaeon]